MKNRIVGNKIREKHQNYSIGKDIAKLSTGKMASASSSSANAPASTGATSGPTRAALNRLMSDLKEMQATPPEGCSAAPLNETNLFLWNASIIGPDDSPWEGGIYSLRLQFPESYPSKPPRVRKFLIALSLGWTLMTV